jgi:hypothetical protein
MKMETIDLNLKKKIICVVDNGLFVSFARTLAKEFGKVYYYTPWQSSFPKSQQLCIGKGFDEIERVNFPLDHYIDKVDLWVFLDLYHSDLQIYLERNGCRVWGARRGEEMELYRWDFKKYLKHIGLPVQPMEHFVGFDRVIEYLKKEKDKFIKTSFVRGDFETFHHETYELSKPRLDEIRHVLGPVASEADYIIEDSIPDAVEIGYDGFTIDGQFPSHAMMAYEIKDCGMIGISLPYSKLAEPVKYINNALVPALKGYRYRGFFSTEIRYTKSKKPYFIDPCCRLGTPSNELLQELFNGWGRTIWDGAEGKVTTPVVANKYSVMAVIHSEWAVSDWQAVYFPKELDEFVKLRFHTRIEGKDYVVPQVVGMPDLGGVVGSGKTLLEAIAQCKERAKLIKGYLVKVSLESIGEALETIEKGVEMGIKFGDDPLPTKAQVERC